MLCVTDLLHSRGSLLQSFTKLGFAITLHFHVKQCRFFALLSKHCRCNTAPHCSTAFHSLPLQSRTMHLMSMPSPNHASHCLCDSCPIIAVPPHGIMPCHLNTLIFATMPLLDPTSPRLCCSRRFNSQPMQIHPGCPERMNPTRSCCPRYTGLYRQVPHRGSDRSHCFSTARCRNTFRSRATQGYVLPVHQVM